MIMAPALIASHSELDELVEKTKRAIDRTAKRAVCYSSLPLAHNRANGTCPARPEVKDLRDVIPFAQQVHYAPVSSPD